MRAAVTVSLVLLLLASVLPAAEARPHGEPRDATASPRLAPAVVEGGNSTLVVVANATGGDASFAFDAAGPGVPAFTLATENGTAQVSFTNLSSNATFRLNETLPSGWRLTGASCDAGSPSNLTLPENGTATCWFDHEKLASLTVQVNATGADGNFTFAGAGAGLPASFTLATTNGTGSVTLADLTPGENLSVAQVVPSGWALTNSTCQGNLTLAPGEAATCVFSDEKLTFLHVVVTSQGGEGTFAFAGSGPGMPASFNVTTANGTGSAGFALEPNSTVNATITVPAGWKLESGSCANVTVAANATATCAFTLARLAAIHVTLATTGGDGSFVLQASVGGEAPANVTLNTTNGSASLNMDGVDPDQNYTLVLLAPSGWSVAASPCVNVTPGAGGNVTCAFSATALGAASGRVVNDTSGAGIANVTVYVDSPGGPNATTNATGAYWIGGLSSGNHTVRVVVPSGWRLVSPESGSYAVNVSAGNLSGGLDFRLANTTRHGEDEDHGGHEEREAPGGGMGYWKNWDNHLSRAQVDAWVANVSASSAWLMPTGYAANADGLVDLLTDSTRGCHGNGHGHGHGDQDDDASSADCATLKLEAKYLVLRMNLASGNLAWNDTREVHGEHASETGLSGRVTLRQVVDAFEAQAGHALSDSQLRAWSSLLEGGEG